MIHLSFLGIFSSLIKDVNYFSFVYCVLLFGDYGNYDSRMFTLIDYQ